MTLQKLFSAPPALVRQFGCIPGHNWYAANDPVGRKLGSGGGTANLIAQAWRDTAEGTSFMDWFRNGTRRIIVHAGGQSRRLPAYAACGKAITPLPVFRWARGQRIRQTLIEAQMPLYERILENAPGGLNWLVASGDALVRAEGGIPRIPTADIVCAGLWTEPDTALSHGVFFSPRDNPFEFSFMLQKPALDTLREKAREHLFQLDIGLWLLSDRAMLTLMRKSGWDCDKGEFDGGEASEYDMYGGFGPCLGTKPTARDPDLSGLNAALFPLPGGHFHHFGSNRDLLRSSLALQNAVQDQREVQMRFIKPHPDLFVQNAVTEAPLDRSHSEIWIENSCIPKSWKLRSRHIVTGVPENRWMLDLPAGACLDIVPVGRDEICIRVYGMNDAFRGAPADAATLWMEKPAREWFGKRALTLEECGLGNCTDLQNAALFPVMKAAAPNANLIQWMLDSDRADDPEAARKGYLASRRMSADELGDQADLTRLFSQRAEFLGRSVTAVAEHAERSVFYQCDLDDMADIFVESGNRLPDRAPDPQRDRLFHAQDRMFRAQVLKKRGQDGQDFHDQAFADLRQLLTGAAKAHRTDPRSHCVADQIISGRCPLRFDLAGGWTDTPPHCLFSGGRVLNMGIELNGQPPIQIFARVTQEPRIVIRSIDLGLSSALRTYEDIADYAKLGSGFAIAKGALALAGFLPEFALTPEKTLRAQLEKFGGGIELSLLAAVPKGSGLGTSSILAATILGVLGQLCGLGWDEMEICRRTLVLEQMLTSGGGWQDQFGGVLRGIKYLQTRPGIDQTPEVRYLPEHLFEDPANRACMLLYYTGITRVAKDILGEIVNGMFLNRSESTRILEEIGAEADDMYCALQRNDFADFGKCLSRTWLSKRRLDAGSCPEELQKICDLTGDCASGMSVGGAGGGGFMLIAAKDPEAAARIRRTLTENPPNERARFVDMSLASRGLQITRS